jgi:hypothetical protein
MSVIASPVAPAAASTTPVTVVTAAVAETAITYEVYVTLSDDTEELRFMIHYFLDVDDAFVCYQEVMCELGKSFAAIELIESDDFELVRLLDRATTEKPSEMKSIQDIYTVMEAPVSVSEVKKEIARMRENTKKCSGYNPATEEKRKRLRKTMKGMKDTENKREREKYESSDSDASDASDASNASNASDGSDSDADA